MRRSDRQVTDRDRIIDIMRRCDVCRLAFNDTDRPYIVPLNFGMTDDGEVITLYFHSATEGKKLDLMRADPRVAFEMDCAHRLVSDAATGHCTMEYESVMGTGTVRMVDDGKKVAALKALVGKYHPEGFEFNMAAVPRTAVYMLTVETMTAKARKVTP